MKCVLGVSPKGRGRWVGEKVHWPRYDIAQDTCMCEDWMRKRSAVVRLSVSARSLLAAVLPHLRDVRHMSRMISRSFDVRRKNRARHKGIIIACFACSLLRIIIASSLVPSWSRWAANYPRRTITSQFWALKGHNFAYCHGIAHWARNWI